MSNKKFLEYILLLGLIILVSILLPQSIRVKKSYIDATIYNDKAAQTTCVIPVTTPPNTPAMSYKSQETIPDQVITNIAEESSPAPTGSSVSIKEAIINKYSLTIIENTQLGKETLKKAYYDEGEKVSISATIYPNNSFIGWTGDVSDPGKASTSVLIDKDKVITANYQLNRYDFSIELTGQGQGSISDHNSKYDALSIISVRATPDMNSIFEGWYLDGALLTINHEYAFTIDNNTKIQAKFSIAPYPIDLTDKIEFIGNPFKTYTYGRNVWDMQVYNGNIYFGYGDTINNAGPIDVIRYNSAKGALENVYTVDEEQIGLFRIIDGSLYIPGFDSRESWDFGNYYTYKDGSWNKYRTLTLAIHAYDMASYNGKLYAATGTNMYSAVLVCNNPENETKAVWEAVTPLETFVASGNRAYNLFEFQGVLYASSVFANTDNCSNNNLLCINNNDIGVIKINGSSMFPGIDGTQTIKLLHPQEINDKLLYIASIRDGESYKPKAMYTSASIGIGLKIVFPDPEATPYDILVRDSTVYVLTNKEADGNKVIVYKSSDLKSWSEYIRFSSATYARSFEELNGDFYFGLGCDLDNLSESAGNLYKITSESIEARN